MCKKMMTQMNSHNLSTESLHKLDLHLRRPTKQLAISCKQNDNRFYSSIHEGILNTGLHLRLNILVLIPFKVMTNVATYWLAFLPHRRHVPDLNLGQETSHTERCFLKFSSVRPQNCTDDSLRHSTTGFTSITLHQPHHIDGHYISYEVQRKVII
jgi:hypothetical protein